VTQKVWDELATISPDKCPKSPKGLKIRHFLCGGIQVAVATRKQQPTKSVAVERSYKSQTSPTKHTVAVPEHRDPRAQSLVVAMDYCDDARSIPCAFARAARQHDAPLVRSKHHLPASVADSHPSSCVFPSATSVVYSPPYGPGFPKTSDLHAQGDREMEAAAWRP
jgi:hypothetical protein